MTCIDFFQKVLMSDAQTGDLAGGAVAIHGDLAIVGAGLGDGANSNQGATYIFHKSDTMWLFEAKLIANDGAVNDQFGGPNNLSVFGNAVDIFGNTAIVGAAFHNSDITSNTGSTYIFTRSDDGTWTQAQELFAPSDTAEDARFGRSVAINDQFAVIGNDDTLVFPAGAHIFQKSDSIWNFTQKITPSDSASMGEWQVAIDNTTIIVGAADTNSAYVFTYDGATWSEQTKLTPSDGGTNFGASVDIACDYAVVGDQLGNAAYVFKRSDTTWTQQQKLITGGNATSVTIDGCFIAVGSQNSNSSQGQTLLYQRSDTTWTQIDAIMASDGLAGDNFGKAVALSYPYIIVGAPGDDSDVVSNTGSAYFYHIACSNCCVKLSDLHAPAVCTDSFFDVFFDLQLDDAHVTLSFNGSDYISDFTQGDDRSFHIQAPNTSSDYVGTLRAVGISNRCCSDVKSLTVTIDTAVSDLAIAVNPSDTVCAGTEITLTASGAHHYLWFDGSSDNPHSFTPTQTSDYQVIGYSANNACSDGTFRTITVKTRPVVGIAVSSDTVCAGTPVTFTASGAETYVWFDGSDENPHTFTPIESSDYYVTGTSDGCSSDTFVHITVKPRPVVGITVSSDTVCAGTPVTFTASGAETYVWFDGSDENPHTFTPTTSSDYGVTGSSDGCSSDTFVHITVKTRPVVSIGVSSDTVCAGTPVTLTASGAQTYVWFDSATENPHTFTPTTSSDYTVTGTSDGCSSDAFVHITVKPRPVVTIDASATVVCSDKSVTLTASGAQTYVWFDNSTNNPLTFTPTATSDYRVIGTSDGCSSDAFVHITVKTPVTVDAGPDRMIPTGSATIIGVGPALSDVQYFWSPTDGISDPNAFPTTATPPSDITYTVVAQRTDVSDCATSDSVTIHVCELLLSDLHFYAFSANSFQVQGYQFADEPGTRFVSAQYLNAPIQIQSFDSDGSFLFAFTNTPISDGALATIAAYRSDCASDVATVVSNKTQSVQGTLVGNFIGSLMNFTLTLPPELSVQIPNNSGVHAVFSDMCAYADAIDCQKFLAGLVINDSSDLFCSDAVILQNPAVVVVTCSDTILNLNDLDQRFTFSITNFMSDSVFIQYSDTSCQVSDNMNLLGGNFSFQNSDVNFLWTSPCLSDSLNVYTNIFSHPLLIIDAEGSIADVDLIDCVCPCHNPTSDLLYTATLRDTAIKFGEYLEAHYSDYPSLVSDQCHVLYQGPIIAGVVRLDFNTRTILYHDLYIPLSDVNICQ